MRARRCVVGLLYGAIVVWALSSGSVLAQTVGLTGELTLVWADPVDQSASPQLNVYIFSGVAKTRLTFAPGAQPDEVQLLKMNRQNVRAIGAPAARARDSSDEQVFVVQQLDRVNPSPSESALTVSGPQPWITLFCRFGDALGVTPAVHTSVLTGSSYPSLDNYWREVSFNNIDLTGSAASIWVNLPQPHSYYFYDTNHDGVPDADLDRLATDCTAASDPYVNFPSYVGINIIVNQYMNMWFGGGHKLTLDGITRNWAMTWIAVDGVAGSTFFAGLAHEMGHGFGLPHSSGPYGQVYDSKWDVMSNSYVHYDPANEEWIPQHTIIYHKDLAGWISAARKFTAARHSHTTIRLERSALPLFSSGAYLMAKIPVGGSAVDFYTLEFRQLVGLHDIWVPGAGVIIHRVMGGQARVVDADNNGDPNDDGAMWVTGEAFDDVANGVTVAINSITTDSAVVTISLEEDVAAFFKSAPGVGASGLATSLEISWTSSNGATGYEYCYDTTNDGACSGVWTPVGSLLVARLKGLRASTSYYWQVRAITASGTQTYADGSSTTFSSFTTATLGDVNADGLADLVWHNSANGTNVAWYLNGTTFLSQASLPTVTDPAWQPVATADIDNDGHADLIWRNTQSGANVVWYLNGSTLLSQASFPSVTDPTWQIVACVDVNMDGHADLIWRNTTSGSNVVWYLNGTTLTGQADLPAVTDATWQLVTSADMNQDGRPDLIWRNTRSGANVVWYLNDTTILSQASLPAVVDPTWRLMGALDINLDGWPDLIWRNTLSGENIVWLMNGAVFVGQQSFPSVTDPTWQLIGATSAEVAVDVNRDRHPDLIWRNVATGANVVWYLDGTTLLGQEALVAVADPAWQIAAKADVNGDGHPDLIWRNTTTGDNVVWYLSGPTLLGQANLTPVADTNWRIVGAADINGDTHPDLVWRNAATGANVVWYLNGVTLLEQVSLPTMSNTTWQIVAIADLNRDTHPDLIWRNTASGADLVWYLNGISLLGQESLLTVADTTWQIVGSADVNRDGYSDLIWRNAASGSNVVWYLNGTSLLGQASLVTVSDTNWTLRPGG